MIPRIIFRYSWIYDQGYRESKRIQRFLEKKGEKYPSPKKIESYIKKVEPLWRKEEKRIAQELSKISGLEWMVKEITCYVIGNGIPFSDPLTIRIYRNYNDFIDTLTHELIHQLFTQKGNMEIAEKSWDYIFRRYKDESFTTKIHIPLHAIHAELIARLYNEKDIEKRLQIPPHEEYKISWQIVQKEGYQDIINEFRKRLK